MAPNLKDSSGQMPYKALGVGVVSRGVGVMGGVWGLWAGFEGCVAGFVTRAGAKFGLGSRG